MRQLVFACIYGSLSLLATADTHGDVAHAAEPPPVVSSSPASNVQKLGDRAADAASDEATIVARVGTDGKIHARELEAALGAMPPFQRDAFGITPDAVRRHFLMEVLVPRVLLALGAESRELASQARTAYEIERARSSATLRALRGRIGSAAAISMLDVEKYYDDNRARYDTPERYQLWRILCPTREVALVVLDQMKRDSSAKRFSELARDNSLDKATNLRDGNLGFLTTDGSSNEPGLRVDPAVVHAAQSVRDGEIVPTPVAEGRYFSVVWRRGTIPANRRTVDAVAAQIRDAIWKSRVKESTDVLLTALRAAKLRDYDDAILEEVELPKDDAGAR